jgi:hypothetical protein
MTRRSALGVALGLFLAGGLLLLLLPIYPAIDLLAYVSIAKGYAAGHLTQAINGCWSPLGSWLLVPFLWAGVDPLIGYRIIHLLIGGLALVGVSMLSRRFEMTDEVRMVVILVAALLLLVFYYVPDLLFCTSLVFYLHQIMAPDYSARPRRGLACGALGALGYLSKSYGLPIFLLHFTLANLLHRLRGGSVLRSYSAGVLTFALLVGPWIGALSVKYGHFTTNTVGGYTYAVSGPGYPAHPTFFEGFIAPPHDAAISAWEDPSLLPVRTWSPFGSLGNFKHQIKLTLEACSNLLKSYNGFSCLWVAILLFYLVRCIPLRPGLRSDAAIPLMTVLIFPIGYLAVQIDPYLGRYVWINAILFLMMGGHAVHFLSQRADLGRARNALMVAVLAGSFLPGLVWKANGYVTVAQEERAAAVAMGREVQLPDSRIASNTKVHKSTYLSYCVGGSYYGAAAPGTCDAALRASLAEHQIDYYIYWSEPVSGFRGVPAFLGARRDITGGRHDLFRVYELRGEDKDGSMDGERTGSSRSGRGPGRKVAHRL